MAAVVDSGLVALAWILAFNIRFDYGVPPRYQACLDFDVILVVVGVKILTFIVFGLYDPATDTRGALASAFGPSADPEVLDHLVLAETSYFSFRENRQLT